MDGFEGDDLIATATRLLTATRERSVLIASADKDLLALVSGRVEVHSTRTGNRIGPDEVKAKLGVGPGLVVDYLTLVGDASDNIKGAKGIGPKTAAEILGFFGSLDAVYLAIDTGSASSLKPAQLASLEELSPRLETVRQLVRMRTDVPLDIEAVFQPRVPKVVETFMEGDEMENEGNEPTQETVMAGSLPGLGIAKDINVPTRRDVWAAKQPDRRPTQEVAKAYVYPTGARDSSQGYRAGTAQRWSTCAAPAAEPPARPGRSR